MIGSRRKAHQAAIEAAAKGVPPNEAVKENLGRLDKVAVVITDHIGTMGFFFIDRAGMSLGLDALLAQRPPTSSDNPLLRFYRRFA